MVFVNEHYLKLTAGYLFPEIDRRVDEFLKRNPDAQGRLINCGIGDVTEPLPESARNAMKRAVDELADHGTFQGYGPATGYDFLRSAIAGNDYRARGIGIAEKIKAYELQEQGLDKLIHAGYNYWV